MIGATIGLNNNGFSDNELGNAKKFLMSITLFIQILYLIIDIDI